SSLAALLGSLGQAAYAAGNAFLDALARARAAEGLPGTAVQWGPHADVGMTTALGDGGARLASHGLEHFTPAEGSVLFGRVVARAAVEVALVRFSLRRWLETTPQMSGSRFLAELPAEGGAEADAGGRAAIERAPAGERRPLLAAHVARELGRVLRMAPEKIGRTTPFTRLGLDSLMSLETRNRLERSLGLRLAPTLCFTYTDADSLTEFLAGELGLVDEADEADDDDDVLARFDESMRALAGDGGA
ncbi:MAG: KR domain-containing protein, partial [Myxococcales bacterium]|nr:KR domain-containing protein [Myxococcales bacterium]